MTLLIQDFQVPELLPMAECIEAMEEAFAQYARGIAVNYPRLRLESETANPAFLYMTNVHVGMVPRYNTSAIRAGMVRRPREEQHHRVSTGAQHENRNWGVIYLYSLETCQLLAIIHEFTLSGIRVGATTAMAVKHLARGDAAVVGQFGSGKVARADLEGVSLVRPLRRVKVFSPNREHRESYAREMRDRLGLEMTAVEDPREVVWGSDIILCSTNASTPVFDGGWLEAGQTVTTVANSDNNAYLRKPAPVKRSEVDETTFVRADAICINDKETVLFDNQRELLEPIERGLFGWEKVHEIGHVVAGDIQVRRRPEDIVYFKANSGMAIQMAAAGAVIYQHALEREMGQQIPTEWFGTDLTPWYEKGYSPSA